MKILVVSFLLASACKTGAAPAPKATESAAPPAAAVAFDGMDLSVSPGDDFFAYTNGGWFKTTEIPADRSSWGTFAGLAELTAKRTAELIAEATRADAPAGSDARKIGDYYATFLDEAGIEAKGLAPLQPKLDAIAALHDAQGLAQALGSTVRADVDVLNNTNLYTANVLGLWVAQDLDDPTRYSPFLLQGGLTMPDRDYYLNPSPRMVEIRAKYQAHVAALLKLAGAADGEAKAARIFELERRLAESHTSRGESEDVLKGNNHWSRAELEKRAPGLDWKTFLAAAGLGDRNEFVIWQPAALIGLAALVKSAPLSNWKEYLTFHALSRAAPLLPKAFVDETFNFFGKVLSGTPQLRDRWKRAVDATDAALGEAVGKLYVAKYFPPSEKARAEEMVKNELAAFAKRIDKLEWMAPATREQAKQKVAALKVGVGYPDKWRDYSALEVVRGDALGNAERAGLFELKRNLARLGQPVDRGERAMDPQLVNAVNLPALNALNFPAALLQPPFFDPARPAAMDYGATGATIGHASPHCGSASSLTGMRLPNIARTRCATRTPGTRPSWSSPGRSSTSRRQSASVSGSRLAAAAALLFACQTARPMLVAPRGQAGAPGAVLFEEVRIFDGDSDALSAPIDVLVKDGRIAAIAPHGEIREAAARVDGRGKTLLPGLIDCHVHLGGGDGTPPWTAN